ncbi:uncharacterized protein KIAA1614 homolog isoform X2 [Ambystoma mexicanum]|uniref:uncharacterized protein KIAA1614 homolog isoform X2 n=1 Tax=Ambystoma mexicanum TaxID=8296 RepID=UPI0037E86248
MCFPFYSQLGLWALGVALAVPSEATMDEPHPGKRKAFQGRKARLRSFFREAQSSANSETVDPENSLSENNSPSQCPATHHSVGQHIPPERGQEPHSQQHRPGQQSSSLFPNHGTQPEQEPISATKNHGTQPEQGTIPSRQCSLDCPGQGHFPACCLSVEHLELEPSSLLPCPTECRGSNLYSAQGHHLGHSEDSSCSPEWPATSLLGHPLHAERPKQGPSSMQHCFEEKPGLRLSAQQSFTADHSRLESSPPNCSADSCGNEPSFVRHRPTNQTKSHSSPSDSRSDCVGPYSSSCRHGSSCRTGTDSSPRNCLVDQFRTESSSPRCCPTDQRSSKCSLQRHNAGDHLTPEPPSQRYRPAGQSRTHPSQRRRLADQPRPDSSSPRHPLEGQSQVDTSFLCYLQEGGSLPDPSSPKHPVADQPRFDSTPRHRSRGQPRPESSSRAHSDVLSRPNCSPPKHHPADRPRPEPSSETHCCTDQFRAEPLLLRHLPGDQTQPPKSYSPPPQCPSDHPKQVPCSSHHPSRQPTPGSSSPKHHSAERTRPASSSLPPQFVLDQPRYDTAYIQLPGGESSVLLSKVKALKENRTLGKETASATPHRSSHKNTKTSKEKTMQILETDGSSCEDALVNPESQIRTYLTESLLINTEELGGPEVPIVPILHTHDNRAIPLSEWPPEDLCISQEDPWESQGPNYPETNMQITMTGVHEHSATTTYASANLTHSVTIQNTDHAQLSFPQDGQSSAIKGVLDTSAAIQRHVLKDDPLVTIGLGGRLWRAESCESIGSNTSSGSSTSLLTLAERVERNRLLLKGMLNFTELSGPYQDASRDLCPGSEGHIGTKAANTVGPLLNDGDWDSGVSLPDSEGCRAEVPPQELALSARHEQAKQLLLRARMKARTSPLRASHHLLPPPAATAAPETTARIGGTSPDLPEKQSCPLRDGVAPPSGSLSDSSSGDSSSGQRRRHRGPSPSRVRFEDESARDAEARYQERLQQRQKRVLDSVILSLGQGPLVSKPELSDYINGEGLQQGDRISKNCKRQNCVQAMGQRRCGLETPSKTSSTSLTDKGRGSSCGSSFSSSDANPISGPVASLTGNKSLESGEIPKQWGSSSRVEAGEPKPLHPDATAAPLTPRGPPLWILPSRQRIHTEKIRETYIGEVTYIDDVDSALDSTDTSDSGRTDSEEVGGVNNRPIGRVGRLGRPTYRRALVTSSNAVLKTEQRPSHADNVSECQGGVSKAAGVLATLTDDKGRSDIISESCLMGTEVVGIKPVEATGDISSPSPASRDQKHQRSVGSNVGPLSSDQEPAVLLSKSTGNSWEKQGQMESCLSKALSKVPLSRSRIPTEQTQKLEGSHCNIKTCVPGPPAGKVPSTVPYRKAAIAGSNTMGNRTNELPLEVLKHPGSIPRVKKTLPVTTLATLEVTANCLHPDVKVSVESGGLAENSLPPSKRQSNKQDLYMCEAPHSLPHDSPFDIEGGKQHKLTSASECEAKKNIQLDFVPVHDGLRPNQTICVPGREQSFNVQSKHIPVLKGQMCSQRKCGPDSDNKKKCQPDNLSANEGNISPNCGSGPEGQKHPSRNSRSATLQKTRLGSLSTNNCNNTRLEQCQLDKPLAGGDKTSVHTSLDHQAGEKHSTLGASSSLEGLVITGQNQWNGHLQQGPMNNMGLENDTLPVCMPGELCDKGFPSSDRGSISSMGIHLSLVMGYTESDRPAESTCPETPEDGPEQKGATKGRSQPLKTEATGPEQEEQPSPVARKRSGSATSLRKFFSTIGQKTQQKLGRGRSASLEHIATPDTAGPASPPKLKPVAIPGIESTDQTMKKTPSLQSLRLVTPFRQLRKAASAQNLNSSTGKTDRSSCYLLRSTEDHRADDRKGGGRPRRTLSVEDIGAPDRVRAVGRITEAFPDGTCQLELRRPPNGSFGFCISSGNGRPDTGVYVQEMADAGIAKLYAGLLSVGDEILEVNGAKVAGVSLATLRDLMAQAETLSIRLLQQRRPPR